MATGGSVSELKLVIHDNIVNDATIDGLVSGRVFSHHLQEEEANQIAYPIAIFAIRAGRMDYTSSYQATLMELWAYSRIGPDEAMDLYDSLKNVIHMERLTTAANSRVVVCQEVERPNEGWNETTRAWFAQGRWIVRSIG